eukprot:6214566-Pleurochrysis_carterae.AAC.10
MRDCRPSRLGASSEAPDLIAIFGVEGGRVGQDGRAQPCRWRLHGHHSFSTGLSTERALVWLARQPLLQRDLRAWILKVSPLARRMQVAWDGRVA